MKSTELRDFLIGYTRYALDSLEPTQKELKGIFRQWQTPTYWSKYARGKSAPLPSPVHRISTRIKNPEAVLHKIFAKPNQYGNGPLAENFEHMHDALGVRVVVFFLSSLPLVDKEIKEGGLFEVSEEKPPFAYLGQDIYDNLGLTMERRQKASGYASIHYVLRLKKSVLPEEDRPWFELQLRTVTEDTWAEVEHVLGYKPNKQTSVQVKKQFQIISNLLSAIDEHFNLLQEQLSHYQVQANYDDSDPINTENLPGVLTEFDVRCSQFQVNTLLKLLGSRGVHTVGDFRTIATKENLDMVADACRTHFGRAPGGDEIVSALMSMYRKETVGDRLQALMEWMEFRKLWDDFKGAADIK